MIVLFHLSFIYLSRKVKTYLATFNNLFHTMAHFLKNLLGLNHAQNAHTEVYQTTQIQPHHKSSWTHESTLLS